MINFHADISYNPIPKSLDEIFQNPEIHDPQNLLDLHNRTLTTNKKIFDSPDIDTGAYFAAPDYVSFTGMVFCNIDECNYYIDVVFNRGEIVPYISFYPDEETFPYSAERAEAALLDAIGARRVNELRRAAQELMDNCEARGIS